MKFVSRYQKFALIIAGLMFPVITCAQNFSDVPSDYKHQEAISYLSDQGIINGYSDGSFRPEETINRAEVVKAVIESEFSQSDIDNCITENASSGWNYIYFSDVGRDQWYAKYVCMAVTNGVIGGYPDGTFKPENKVNFAEGLKMVIGENNTDVNRVRVVHSSLLYINDDDWFAKYFSYAYNKNLINKEKFYHPAQMMTRGDFAETLYRALMIKKNGLESFQDSEAPFSDEYTITIPRLNIINLNVSFADVYDSKNALEALKNGLGHYLAPPGSGKKMVLFGHSSGYSWDKSAYKNILRQINKLEVNDNIYINYQEKGYVYQVYNKEIIPASQLDTIMKDGDNDELDMYTCWPPDSIRQRYVIYAAPVL
jgi:LPXTG-site transpeptidase (sortase) family protein